jgi:FAD/FMN-containing dehydrogenase
MVTTAKRAETVGTCEREWVNWSGSVRCRPGRIARPRDEAELVDLVQRAARKGCCVRAVGSGHSSSSLVATDDTIVSLESIHGVRCADPNKRIAELSAGTTLQAAGQELFEHGLALHNLGDIDQQSLAGSLMTGTHGTGRHLPILSDAIVGGRLVTGQGDILDVSIEREPELLAALRVSLGALGIFSIDASCERATRRGHGWQPRLVAVCPIGDRSY